MADPVTIGAIGLGASAAGGVAGAFGSLFSGGAKSNMYQYQAGVAQLNKQISEQNASYARAVGEVEAEQSGMQTRARIAQTKVAQSRSGIDVSSGSPALVRDSESDIGQFDQAVIRSNAAKRAYGFEVEAAQNEAQSTLDMMGASTARTEGKIGAVTSILGGASSVSSKWLQGKQVGLWGSDA